MMAAPESVSEQGEGSRIAAIVVHDHGRQTRLTLDSPKARELAGRCEEQLRTADSVLRLAVTPQRIQEILDKEVAVEVLYGSTATFTVSFGMREIKIRRLLIPLTGELAGEVTTIFYGNKRYEAGPYRNRRGSEEIRALVTGLVPPAAGHRER